MNEGITGIIPHAVYGKHQLKEHSDNPLIACLPDIFTNEYRIRALRLKPEFNEIERNLDGRVRAHAICRLLDDFFQPLNHHLALEDKISLMIRNGYKGRNPETGQFHEHLQNGYARSAKGDLEAYVYKEARSTASSLSLFGCSGCGKSRAVERIFSLYPQARFHPQYNITQLVYLKLECPSDGDLIALCLSFFQAVDNILGSRYVASHGRKKLGEVGLLSRMCQIANLHALGVLVIDEVQNLSEAKSGGEKKMHNFFVSLTNTIGVPLIQIGTPKAQKFFQGTFRNARRVTGMGSLQWDRLLKDNQWRKLLETLWKFQWLQNPKPLDDQLDATMYDLTQGVMDIVIKLFVLSQVRAIVTGLERITPTLLKAVYEDEFKPVHPMLAALRSGRPDRIRVYDDLVIHNIEAKALTMVADIASKLPDEKTPEMPSGDKAKRLLSILESMDIPRDTGLPMVEAVLATFPNLPIPTLINELTKYAAQESVKKPKVDRVKQSAWANLDHDDVRQIFATADSGDVHAALRDRGLIFDLQVLLKTAS